MCTHHPPPTVSLPLNACPPDAAGAHLIRRTGMFHKPMKFISVARAKKPFVLLFSRGKCRSLLVKHVHNGVGFYHHSEAGCVEMTLGNAQCLNLAVKSCDGWGEIWQKGFDAPFRWFVTHIYTKVYRLKCKVDTSGEQQVWGHESSQEKKLAL